METQLPVNLTALIAVGIGLSFWLADRRTKTSQMLSLLLVSIGVGIFVNVNQFDFGSFQVWWLRLTVLPALVSMYAAAEWVYRVRQTIPNRGLATSFADRSLRVVQGLALLYAILGMVLPEVRHQYFLPGLSAAGILSAWQFWLFALPFFMAALLLLMVILMTLRRRPDPGEYGRFVALSIATPLLAVSLILPLDQGLYTTVMGQIAILVGGVLYHVRQGERAQFMTRFLAPQVAEVVAKRGLATAMQERTLELSVVACDIRGFTRYAEKASPHEVITFLQEYYGLVGDAAREHGGTIKDYAGDGVLVLVGAPVSYSNHRQRALGLAADIRTHVGATLKAQQLPLGIGVGVAAGEVSVGVVGGDRLEYAAVGAAVNLASRLCDQAADGEILVDQKSFPEQQGSSSSVRELALKGIEAPVTAFAN